MYYACVWVVIIEHCPFVSYISNILRYQMVRASAGGPGPESPKPDDKVNLAAESPFPAERVVDLPPVTARKSPPTFVEVMGFSGLAPELINGRLAMLAFVAAAAAKLRTGEPILQQFQDAPVPILIASGLLIAASLIPLRASSERPPYGIFTPLAEVVNGRAAMVGFAALLLIDTATKTHFN